MRKLLLPFDGSDNAVRALKHAVKLAKRDGQVSIHAVIAHEEPAIYGEIAVYVSHEKMAELQRQHSEAILSAAEKLLKRAGIPFKTEVLIGHVPAVIAKRADELRCDGIVMGTRGMTAIGNLVMGSVATKVVHLARMPVTLVK